MKFSLYSLALIALTSIGVAQAQDTTTGTDWRGPYVGANIGGAWNHTCSSWIPGPVITGNPTLATAFYDRNCPNNGNFIGGADLGYNFQYNQWVWGFKADYEAVGNKTVTRSYNYTATSATDPISSGTYTASGKLSPNGIGLLGPRIGYAFDAFLPYFRAGAAFAGGQHAATFAYTPEGVTTPANSFSSGKNFKSTGWNAGVGFDYGLGGPWSLTAEYNYVNLGKGTNSTFACSTASGAVPPVCAKYADLSLDNIHNSFTMNMFRVGFHYRFGGRSPPERAAASPAPPPPSPPPPPPPPTPPLPPPPPASLCPGTPARVAVDQYGCPCDMTQEVHFATNSAELTDQDKALLDKMIVTLKRLNFVDGEVDGYTDSTGSAAYNQRLSERRAQAVADYLSSNGVAEHRLAVKGYGQENPVADNKTADGRAHNRRVVLHRTGCGK